MKINPQTYENRHSLDHIVELLAYKLVHGSTVGFRGPLIAPSPGLFTSKTFKVLPSGVHRDPTRARSDLCGENDVHTRNTLWNNTKCICFA